MWHCCVTKSTYIKYTLNSQGASTFTTKNHCSEYFFYIKKVCAWNALKRWLTKGRKLARWHPPLTPAHRGLGLWRHQNLLVPVLFVQNTLGARRQRQFRRSRKPRNAAVEGRGAPAAGGGARGELRLELGAEGGRVEALFFELNSP